MNRLSMLSLVWLALAAISCSGDDAAAGQAGAGGSSAHAGSGDSSGSGGGGSSGSGSATLASIQQTLFTPSCAVASCHDATTHMSDLNLSSAAMSCMQLVDVAATESSATGRECTQGGAKKASLKRVVASDSAHSFLYMKLTSSAECVTVDGSQAGERMPKDRGVAAASAVAAVKQWIDDGASCD